MKSEEYRIPLMLTKIKSGVKLSGLSRSPRDLWPLLGVILAGGLSSFAWQVASPVINLRLDSHHFSALYISLGNVMGPIGTIIAALIFPRMLARLGVARLTVAGTTAAVASLLAYPVFMNSRVIFLLDILGGFGSGFLFLIFSSLLLQLAEPSRRTTVMALFGTCLGAANMLGSASGRFLDDSGNWPFIVAALGTLALVAPLRSVPADLSGEEPPSRHHEPIGAVLAAVISLPSVFIISGAIGAGRASFLGLLPVVGHHLGLADGRASLLLSTAFFGSLALGIPLGWLGDRLGKGRVLFAAGAALAVLAAAAGWSASDSPILWVASFFIGGIFGGAYSLSISLLAGGQRVISQATLLGAFAITGRFGAMGGSLAAGEAVTALGAPSIFWGVAICGALMAGASIFLHRALSREAP